MSITNPQTLKQLGCELWWPGEKATANAPKTVTAFTAVATNIAAVLGIGKVNTLYQEGNIKDLMIFRNKALSQDQIASLYNETYIY